MTQGISDRYWQAEARTEETKQFIRDIKRITRRKFTPEEKCMSSAKMEQLDMGINGHLKGNTICHESTAVDRTSLHIV